MSDIYTIDIKHDDQSEDLYLELPAELMEQIGWKVGDDLKFIDHKDGSFAVKKVKYETVELEFGDEELVRYMTIAHEKNITLNELFEKALEQIIDTKGDCLSVTNSYPTSGNDIDFGTSME